jgi:hypothetical protein
MHKVSGGKDIPMENFERAISRGTLSDQFASICDDEVMQHNAVDICRSADASQAQFCYMSVGR